MDAEMYSELNKLRILSDDFILIKSLIEKYDITPEMYELYGKQTKITIVSGKTVYNIKNKNICEEKNKNQLSIIAPNRELSTMQLITKNIDGKYAYAAYGNIEVIVMKSNGYINASKLCVMANKRFDNWIRLDNAQELIKEVENSYYNELNFESSDLRIRSNAVISIKGGDNQSITGAYVHPDLIVHVASWLSPKFAIMVSKIVNNYIIAEFERQKKIEIGEKNNTIDELNKKLDYMISQNDYVINQNDKLEKINADQTDKINALLNHTTVINHKLDYAKSGFVLSSKEADNNVFIIFSNYGNLMSEGNEIVLQKGFSYSALRLMKKSMNTRILQHFKKYPFAVEILNVANPYANNMWNRLKTELVDRGNIDANYIDFNLKNGYTEEQLINTIRLCNEKRFDI